MKTRKKKEKATTVAAKTESAAVTVRLKELAQEIKTAYSETEDLVISTQKQGQQAIRRAIDCGIALAEAKKLAGAGKWLDWLAKNCKGIHERTARRWIQLAADRTHVSDTCDSLRRAYIEVGILPESTTPRQPKQLPERSQELPVIDVSAETVNTNPVEQSHETATETVPVRSAPATEPTPVPDLSRREDAPVAAAASVAEGTMGSVESGVCGAFFGGDPYSGRQCVLEAEHDGSHEDANGRLFLNEPRQSAVPAAKPPQGAATVVKAAVLAALLQLRQDTYARIEAGGKVPTWEEYDQAATQRIYDMA